jgi:hypothetical protein
MRLKNALMEQMSSVSDKKHCWLFESLNSKRFAAGITGAMKFSNFSICSESFHPTANAVSGSEYVDAVNLASLAAQIVPHS